MTRWITSESKLLKCQTPATTVSSKTQLRWIHLRKCRLPRTFRTLLWPPHSSNRLMVLVRGSWEPTMPGTPHKCQMKYMTMLSQIKRAKSLARKQYLQIRRKEKLKNRRLKSFFHLRMKTVMTSSTRGCFLEMLRKIGG